MKCTKNYNARAQALSCSLLKPFVWPLIESTTVRIEYEIFLTFFAFQRAHCFYCNPRFCLAFLTFATPQKFAVSCGISFENFLAILKIRFEVFKVRLKFVQFIPNKNLQALCTCFECNIDCVGNNTLVKETTK